MDLKNSSAIGGANAVDAVDDFSTVTIDDDTAFEKATRSPFHLVMMICLGVLCALQAFYVIALLVRAFTGIGGEPISLGIKVCSLGDAWWMSLIYAVINGALLAFLIIALIGAIRLYFGIDERKSILQMNDLGKGSSIMKLFSIFNAVDLALYAICGLILSFDLRYTSHYTSEGVFNWSEKIIHMFNFSGYTSIGITADSNLTYNAVSDGTPIGNILTDLGWTMDVFEFKGDAMRTLLGVGIFVVFAAVAILLVTTVSKLNKCYTNLVTRAGNKLAVLDQRPPVIRLYVLAGIQVVMAVIGFMSLVPVTAVINIAFAAYYVSNALYLKNVYEVLEA